MSDNNLLSTRIKELRNNMNLTQKEFAEILHVSTVSVSSYETGTKTPSLDMIINISKKCDVSIDWLCGLSNKKIFDTRIKTYKDLLILFISVLDTRYQDEENIPIIDIIDTDSSAVTLTLHDDVNLQAFFHKWCDIFTLHCEGTIDDDLYDMWIEKQLAEYDRPINGMPF